MRLITFEGLKSRGYVVYSRRHIERLIAAGKFPRPLKIGDGPRGRIAWNEAEIEAHYAAHILDVAGDALSRKGLLRPEATPTADNVVTLPSGRRS